MSELTELERLKEKVVDTKAAYDAYDAAYDAAYAAYGAAYGAHDAATYAAYAAWVKAKLELEDYLEEQDNADVKDN